MQRWCLAAIVLAAVGLSFEQDTGAQTPASTRRYRIIDLGTLGGIYSKAFAINNKGQVAGESLTSANIDAHPFVWTGGAMMAIPGLAGNADASGRINGINNNGRVVGTWDSGAFGDPGQLFVYDLPTTALPGGALSFPRGQGSFGVDVNDAGQILAGGDLDGAFGAPFQGEEINAFGWVIGVPGGPSALPNSYVYVNGSFVSIFGSVGFLGTALNDGNDAAGFVREQTSFFGIRARAAMRRFDGTYQIYGSFNVDLDSRPNAINNLRQIVGTERGRGVRIPFLIENGSMMNLNSLLPSGSGWQLLEAHDINDRSEIVGSGRINGEEHAFLLTPLTCSPAEDADGDGDGDDDGDALCDSWEVSGLDSNGDGTIDLDLPGMGANPDHKDLFVEVDFMDCARGGCAFGDLHWHRPESGALDPVIAAFALAPVGNPDNSVGINLHVVVDEGVGEIEPLRMSASEPLDVINGVPVMPAGDVNDIKLGNPQNPCGVNPEDGHFGTPADRADPNCQHILAARQLVFRYAIFGHNHAHKIRSAGFGELPGNDFAVTLGGWSPQGLMAGAGINHQTAALRVIQGDAFMHELGHTLGLKHGGSDHNNCKPNYLSVMNYSLSYKQFDSTRPLDYSRRQLATLDENSLDEPSGIGGPLGRSLVFGIGFGNAFGNAVVASAFGAVDWTRDVPTSPIHSNLALDINYINSIGPCSPRTAAGNPIVQTTFLTGHDDWASLVYDFRSSPTFADAFSYTVTPPDPESTDDEVLAAAQTVDFDGDGVTNFPDNCPAIANPGQQDADGDGIGDACDAGPPTDVTPPSLTLPADIFVEAAGSAGTVVTFTATAVDTTDGAVPVTCVPASGTLFALGSTAVTCSAADSANNTATGGFGVVVRDTTMPALLVPANMTLAATSASGAAMHFSATATDVVDGARPVVCLPASGSTFPIGTTRVTCNASDLSGNLATGVFDIVVQLGQPRIAGTVTGKGRDATGTFYVDLSMRNTGTGHARSVRINQVSLRTLGGTGIVTLNTARSPTPIVLGSLDAGASAAVRLYLNVPATVTRVSLAEIGDLANVLGTSYSYSAAQTVIP